MTEPNEPDVMPEREIDFQGRKMWVRMPSIEQSLVWKRTLGRLQEISDQDSTNWNGEQIISAIARARKLIDSLLVHEVDREWLDDQMLDRKVGMIEVASIIQKATEAFAADGNRETRRAAKKATRKKATR